MPEPIKWKAWYADGKTYEGEDNDARDLPEDGFLGMMLCHPDGTRRVISGNDIIWIADGLAGPVFGQSNGSLENIPFEKAKAEILARYPGARVIRGKHTDEHTMRRVSDELMKYWGYPPPLKDIMRF